MKDWIVTLPQTVDWDEYQKEINAVADGSQVMNYKVHRPLKEMKPGDKMWLCWRGKVRGWMKIVGIEDHPKGFTCSTTGTQWGSGTYIQRSGKFHKVDGEEMKGFQGVRSYKKETK